MLLSAIQLFLSCLVLIVRSRFTLEDRGFIGSWLVTVGLCPVVGGSPELPLTRS